MLRVGFGYDIHKLVEGRKLILAGIEIPSAKGLLGHSDADVVLHAIIDSLLGAMAEGDIGDRFPDTVEKYKDVSSLKLLEEVNDLVKKNGYKINNIDTTIIAGGPHASALPHQLAQEGFIVVRGEGENTLLELVAQKPLKDIKGITYRGEDGQIHHNPNRPPITDLDSIPFPARYLLPNKGVDYPYRSAASRYATWATVLTSRGCPYACYFCNKNIFSHKFRPRSPENVVD